MEFVGPMPKPILQSEKIPMSDMLSYILTNFISDISALNKKHFTS